MLIFVDRPFDLRRLQRQAGQTFRNVANSFQTVWFQRCPSDGVTDQHPWITGDIRGGQIRNFGGERIGHQVLGNGDRGGRRGRVDQTAAEHHGGERRHDHLAWIDGHGEIAVQKAWHGCRPWTCVAELVDGVPILESAERA